MLDFNVCVFNWNKIDVPLRTVMALYQQHLSLNSTSKQTVTLVKQLKCVFN